VGGATGAGAPQLVIWGTDVDVNRCKERFKRFLERYIDPGVEQDEKFDGMDVEEPIYLQRLEEVCHIALLTYFLLISDCVLRVESVKIIGQQGPDFQNFIRFS